MSGQHCESYDVKQETLHCYLVNSSLLTADPRDGWNLRAVFKFCFCFVLLYNKLLNDWSLGERWILFPSNLNVSLDFVSGNIEILGKQNSLFPSGPVIKCLLFPGRFKLELGKWAIRLTRPADDSEKNEYGSLDINCYLYNNTYLGCCIFFYQLQDTNWLQCKATRLHRI